MIGQRMMFGGFFLAMAACFLACIGCAVAVWFADDLGWPEALLLSVLSGGMGAACFGMCAMMLEEWG